MRRLVSVFSLGALSIVFAFLLATQGASYGAPGGEVAQVASPVGATPAGVEAIGLGQVNLPAQPEA
ncbi:MAG: hypothetical protein H0T72_07600, partial [Chloroflexia bacterium]|nr:hypothetical protein [Chloroflexia bacterium]